MTTLVKSFAGLMICLLFSTAAFAGNPSGASFEFFIANSGDPSSPSMSVAKLTQFTVPISVRSNYPTGGYQFAVEFSDSLHLVEGTLSLEFSPLTQIGAEFINHHVDNNAADVDGDGKELIVGILLDTSPPFNLQTLPATGASVVEICRIEAVILNFAIAGSNLALNFVNGVNGRGDSPVNNVCITDQIVTNNTILFHHGQIWVRENASFSRGDCNDDGQLNIADVIFLAGYLFTNGAPPHCIEACDSNGDGTIDIADAISISAYLFQGGMAPAAPFPNCDQILGADCANFNCP